MSQVTKGIRCSATAQGHLFFKMPTYIRWASRADPPPEAFARSRTQLATRYVLSSTERQNGCSKLFLSWIQVSDRYRGFKSFVSRKNVRFFYLFDEETSYIIFNIRPPLLGGSKLLCPVHPYDTFVHTQHCTLILESRLSAG